MMKTEIRTTMSEIGCFIRCRPDPTIGYGVIAVKLIRHLVAQGVPVLISLLSAKSKEMLDEVPADLRDLVTLQPNPWPGEIIIAPPMEEPNPDCRTLYITMWETTRLHHEMVSRLNRCVAVIVPSEWCQQIFDACGVNAPLLRIPLGADPVERTNWPDRKDGLTVFGTVGRIHSGGLRKGIGRVVEAFEMAFPDHPGVRLLIKCSPRCEIGLPEDQRIHVNRHRLASMAWWYDAIDVYVSGSCAEAWDLPLAEAMARGKPVVATRFGGHGDYMTNECGYVVPHMLSPALGIYQGLGLWGEPELWGLVSGMRLLQRSQFTAGKFDSAVGWRKALSSCFLWKHFCVGVQQAIAHYGIGEQWKWVVHPAVVPLPEQIAHYGIGEQWKWGTTVQVPASLPEHKRIIKPPPTERPPRPNKDIVCMGPTFHGCGVSQYGQQVAKALGCIYVPYGDTNHGVVLLTHHRHYHERALVFNRVHQLFSEGRSIVLDVHDPGGIEDFAGYLSGIVYHSPNFDGECKAAGVPTVRLPLMCPNMPPGGTALKAPKCTLLVGSHGLWVPTKGISQLLEAISILRAREIDAGLLVAGAIQDIDSGSRYRSVRYFDDCWRLAEVLNLHDHVRLYSSDLSYADLRKTLAPCDMFCLPYDTMTPGQSSAVAACMWFGKPVITSNVPMFADVRDMVAQVEPIPEVIANAIWNIGSDSLIRSAAAMIVTEESGRRAPEVLAKQYRQFIQECTKG